MFLRVGLCLMNVAEITRITKTYDEDGKILEFSFNNGDIYKIWYENGKKATEEFNKIELLLKDF